MEIEIKDHVGKSRRGVPVDHDQSIVFCDGVQVGYMGKEPGSWIAAIVAMDDSTREELQAAVNAKLSQPIGGIAVPPEPEVIDEDDELEEYEE